MLCFPATAIQLCQNCPVLVDTRCPGTKVENIQTSEGCYNHLNISNNVKMVSFDHQGSCWAYTTNTCIEPRYSSKRNSSDHGAWSARIGYDTGNLILHFLFLIKYLCKHTETLYQ